MSLQRSQRKRYFQYFDKVSDMENSRCQVDTCTLIKVICCNKISTISHMKSLFEVWIAIVTVKLVEVCKNLEFGTYMQNSV